MAWALVWLPALAGAVLWLAGRHVAAARRAPVLGAGAVGALLATTALAGTEAGLHAVPHGEHATAPDEPGSDSTVPDDGPLLEEHGHH